MKLELLVLGICALVLPLLVVGLGWSGDSKKISECKSLELQILELSQKRGTVTNITI